MRIPKITWKPNKPLIPLKAALFSYFGAGASIFPFLQIFVKQKGITIEQISLIYMINPCVQFLGPIISGIIADKLGRSKPVLLGNVLLTIAFLSSMLFIPHINKPICEKHDIHVTCLSEIIHIENIEHCNVSKQLKCKNYCNISKKNNSYNESVNTQRVYTSNETLTFSKSEIILTVTDVKKYNSSCQIEAVVSQQSSRHWCKHTQTQDCNLTCQNIFTSEIGKDHCTHDDNATLVFYLVSIFLILFHTVVSNGYRIMDVTSMSMVKTYNSDFGRERFWSITGILIFSVLAGYAVEITTKEGQLKNYNTAIYMYIVFAIITMIFVYKLEVAIDPPGKQMFKKIFQIIKNIDVLGFSLAVLILGTCWCFTKQFSGIYLDTLGAPSVLLGLIPTVNSVIGIPFLLTSNFWLEKIGSANILVLAFAGHSVYYIGYVYLVNPWWSLALEITGILNYHLLWVAIVRHSHSIAPEGLTATVISTAGALHYAIGKGSGSMLGGLTMSKYGGRTAYKVMAATSGGGGALYALFLYLRHCCNKKNFKITPETKVEMKADSYIKAEDQGILETKGFPNDVK